MDAARPHNKLKIIDSSFFSVVLNEDPPKIGRAPLKVHAMTTYWYPKLCDDETTVIRWTAPRRCRHDDENGVRSVFGADIILVPVHIQETHWQWGLLTCCVTLWSTTFHISRTVRDSSRLLSTGSRGRQAAANIDSIDENGRSCTALLHRSSQIRGLAGCSPSHALSFGVTTSHSWHKKTVLRLGCGRDYETIESRLTPTRPGSTARKTCPAFDSTSNIC